VCNDDEMVKSRMKDEQDDIDDSYADFHAVEPDSIPRPRDQCRDGGIVWADELINKVQARKDSEAGNAAIKSALQSTSAQHATTLQAETAARRQADIDRKWKERADEEREIGVVEEDAAERQRREELEVAEALRRIEEKNSQQGPIEEEQAPAAAATGAAATVAEKRGRFAEAGSVFGYGGASVLYEKKGSKIGSVVPPTSAPKPAPKPAAPAGEAPAVKKLTVKDKSLFGDDTEVTQHSTTTIGVARLHVSHMRFCTLFGFPHLSRPLPSPPSLSSSPG